MLLKYLISGFLFLIQIGCVVSDNAVPPGFLEGHLKITWLGAAAEPSDAMPRPTVTAETYAEYPLVVLSEDGKTQVARVAADGNGNYRVALPPGNYILDVQRRPRGHVRAKPQPFTVASNQTVHVDMNIVIGFAGAHP
jgi:hypothetical protein